MSLKLKSPLKKKKKNLKSQKLECSHSKSKSNSVVNEVDYVTKFKNKQLRKSMAHALGDREEAH